MLVRHDLQNDLFDADADAATIIRDVDLGADAALSPCHWASVSYVYIYIYTYTYISIYTLIYAYVCVRI